MYFSHITPTLLTTIGQHVDEAPISSSPIHFAFSRFLAPMNVALAVTFAAAATAQQFQPCKVDTDCSKDFTCVQAAGETWSMCQPSTATSRERWYRCRSNAECNAGLFCKPVDDKSFSMCQPNESCIGNFAQCGGKHFVGSSCCMDAGYTCKAWNKEYAQCVPHAWKRQAEATCVAVSVVGDATYCIASDRPICGDQGDACPKKGDVASADCLKTLTSYVVDAKCIAPEDAVCKKLKSGARGCVWTSLVAKKAAADAEAAKWAQCGGRDFHGDTPCTRGYHCVALNEWYAQCQPDATPSGQVATWAQCNNHKCRDEDECTKLNDAYSQCVPRKRARQTAEDDMDSENGDGECLD
ncbi:Aste57867_24996 [Aphanomyces stellatus]|uniref:Aste57867_24996 protein n=1 Tax=Aphanomyces stellatus TaxID=120398 RepID=A0A485LW69_9STRA|nr:hypothetical protein As57867_024918 [Aphanomyces stellatus]VFU01627.1 Aste57867_24996 [Aphanomyces stellatus]